MSCGGVNAVSAIDPAEFAAEIEDQIGGLERSFDEDRDDVEFCGIVVFDWSDERCGR